MKTEARRHAVRRGSPQEGTKARRRGCSAAQLSSAPLFSAAGRAFTFLEVLFAVILIGVGFIMIAGIFPVAIQQSQQDLNEAEGAAVCRDAINQIQQAAISPDGVAALQSYATVSHPAFEAIGPQLSTTANQSPVMVWPQSGATTSFYPLIAGSCVSKIDPRYGWCAFCRRDSDTQPYMQVIVFAAKATQDDQPTYSSFVESSANVIQPTIPVPVFIPSGTTPAVQLNYATQTITLPTSGYLPTGYSSNPIQSGAYLLVAQAPAADAELVGRILQLGTQNTTGGSLDTWNLVPGHDLLNNTETVNGVAVYILGCQAGVENGNLTYTGPAQDITAMTGIVRLY